MGRGKVGALESISKPPNFLEGLQAPLLAHLSTPNSGSPNSEPPLGFPDSVTPDSTPFSPPGPGAGIANPSQTSLMPHCYTFHLLHDVQPQNPP